MSADNISLRRAIDGLYKVYPVVNKEKEKMEVKSGSIGLTRAYITPEDYDKEGFGARFLLRRFQSGSPQGF